LFEDYVWVSLGNAMKAMQKQAKAHTKDEGQHSILKFVGTGTLEPTPITSQTTPQ
jgi:hypothetical protein